MRSRGLRRPVRVEPWRPLQTFACGLALRQHFQRRGTGVFCDGMKSLSKLSQPRGPFDVVISEMGRWRSRIDRFANAAPLHPIVCLGRATRCLNRKSEDNSLASRKTKLRIFPCGTCEPPPPSLKSSSPILNAAWFPTKWHGAWSGRGRTRFVNEAGGVSLTWPSRSSRIS